MTMPLTNPTLLQVLKKANIVQKKKTTEHTRTERQVFHPPINTLS